MPFGITGENQLGAIIWSDQIKWQNVHLEKNVSLIKFMNNVSII